MIGSVRKRSTPIETILWKAQIQRNRHVQFDLIIRYCRRGKIHPLTLWTAGKTSSLFQPQAEDGKKRGGEEVSKDRVTKC